MEKPQNQIHLQNILKCITEIENTCVDLTQDQMEDEELRMSLYRSLISVGMEAAKLDIQHPLVDTLKSFERADFINGIGRDTYAIFNFVVNDLEYLKNYLKTLSSELHNNKSFQLV